MTSHGPSMFQHLHFNSHERKEKRPGVVYLFAHGLVFSKHDQIDVEPLFELVDGLVTLAHRSCFRNNEKP